MGGMQGRYCIQFCSLASANIQKRKGKKFSSTLIHSGASKSAYGAVHFSQSYPRISSIADLVVPMAYHGSNTQVRKLVQEVIDGSKEQIASSLQNYDWDPSL
jgi:hypothetical protein